jgi:hypothetical protein
MRFPIIGIFILVLVITSNIAISYLYNFNKLDRTYNCTSYELDSGCEYLCYPNRHYLFDYNITDPICTVIIPDAFSKNCSYIKPDCSEFCEKNDRTCFTDFSCALMDSYSASRKKCGEYIYGMYGNQIYFAISMWKDVIVQTIALLSFETFLILVGMTIFLTCVKNNHAIHYTKFVV